MKNIKFKNIYINTVIGFILKILLLIFSLINRTIFIKFLSIEYLGIAGLYSNIISILGLADLGIYTAFMFSLYKPLSDNNQDIVNCLIKYFSKIYKIIGIIVIFFGLTLLPFLKFLVNAPNLSESHVRNYYLLFILNSGLSYFNICKSTLLRADKKVYIVDLVTSVITIITYVCQIIVLYFTDSYYFYIIVQILMTIVTNVLLTAITNKLYPYLKFKKLGDSDLSNEIKLKIKNNVKDVLLYKVSNIVINSTDNILISIIVGTIAVGIYSNYSLIIVTLNSFIFIIINALLPNIGELHAKGDSDESYKFFMSISYFFSVLGCFIMTTLINVFNDFIYIWLKDEMFLLNDNTVFCIAFSFYVSCVTNPLWMFRESMGLFKEMKYVLMLAAILNILLSLTLGYYLKMGIGGILLATGIAKILTIFIVEPNLLFKKVFTNKRITNYYLKSFIFLLITILTIVCSNAISMFIEIGLLGCFIKTLLCLIITIFFTIIFTFKFGEFKLLLNIFKKETK